MPIPASVNIQFDDNLIGLIEEDLASGGAVTKSASLNAVLEELGIDHLERIFPDAGDESAEKTLQITIPEDLEYAGLFDDIFNRYTSGARLVRVKTTNLGSLNRLSYELRMLRPCTEKAMIDELRCRNGNLEINLAARCEGSEL